MGKDVIVALDFPTGPEAMAFLEGMGGARPYVKVGMELFYAAGGDLVRALKARGHRVFLDLKLHDIPNTVGSAMRVLAGLGADMVNLHAAGGAAMMRAALEGLQAGAEAAGTARPLLIAVTQLTSTSAETLRRELLIEQPMERVVEAYARNAKAAGLDGVVCSALEVAAVKKALGAGFVAVTPGIRYADGDIGDQARITDPAGAKALGSDYIVVGRPITRAADPAAAYARCVADFVD